ncbi:MAG: toll/interleukin-1 receptor domain-containing protein [Planctomycetes bacterium]|nr:toll/interleukin-1 receptor domain-containing protein [Planctomycetota bacterium]
MSSLAGFWSYVHDDDNNDLGRISQLARDIAAEYEALTGDSIELFLDKDNLEWGDDWRSRIVENLARVAFFVPIVTPRYLQSPECRNELQHFARQAENNGLRSLLLPILYIRTPAFAEASPSDDLVKLLKKHQWYDWTAVRFCEAASREYRTNIHILASKLVDANRTAEKQSQPLPAISPESEPSPGLIDRLAATEEALPKWEETLNNLGQEITSIGSAMQEAATNMRKPATKGGEFGKRLAIAKRLARDLGEPADRFWTFGNEFATQMHEVDDGIRAIIERAPDEISKDPTARDHYCEFFAMVSKLSAAAHDGLGSSEALIEALTPIENLSRDLRPVLRRLRMGLAVMLDARAVSDSWIGLIRSSGVDCPDAIIDDNDLASPDPDGP